MWLFSLSCDEEYKGQLFSKALKKHLRKEKKKIYLGTFLLLRLIFFYVNHSYCCRQEAGLLPLIYKLVNKLFGNSKLPEEKSSYVGRPDWEVNLNQGQQTFSVTDS